MANKGKSDRSVRYSVWNRDGWRCRYCGRQVVQAERQPAQPRAGESNFFSNTATVDHIVPVSAGGLHTMDNLLTACYSCNGDKSNLSVREFLFGDQPSLRGGNRLKRERAARASKRLHARIASVGDPAYALRDMHVALFAERS